MNSTFLKYLVLFFLLQTTKGYSVFSLDEIDKSSYVQHYNKLPTAEVANNELETSSNVKTLFEKANEIITHYELNSWVGLRLIHKHSPIQDNQIVVERFQNLADGAPSLITSAQPWEEAIKHEALPFCWIYPDNEDVQVFETSTDPAIKQGVELLKRNSEFLEELSWNLREYKLNDLLSISILPRKSLSSDQTQIYLEDNSFDGRSIIKLWSKNSLPDNIINTLWSFPSEKEFIVQAACGKKPKPKTPKPPFKFQPKTDA